MSEKDRLFEVTRLLNNTGPLNEEVFTAIDSLRDCFEKNYVRKVYLAADSEERKVKEHPGREVVLLRALKGFSSHEQHKGIDQTIEMLNFFHAIQNIQRELSDLNNNEKTISIKSEDGEEVSVTPKSIQTTQMLMLLALMKKL